MKCVEVSYEEYQEAVDSNLGYCRGCQQFTNDFAEPDARNYTCEDCGLPEVFGAEEALLRGYITVGQPSLDF